MNKNQQKNRMGAVIILLAAACLNGYAQQDSTKVSSDSKEEGNRNVMLNAASANGPREISIGLTTYSWAASDGRSMLIISIGSFLTLRKSAPDRLSINLFNIFFLIFILLFSSVFDHIS